MSDPSNPNPPVPRQPVSLLSRIYLGLGGAAMIFYLMASFLGWDFRSSERNSVPPSARSSPGGYRSFHFWHGGFHGGK